MEFGKWILTPVRLTYFPLSIQVGPKEDGCHSIGVIRKGPTLHLSERARSKGWFADEKRGKQIHKGIPERERVNMYP